uniref:Uncharacterized protein n=1 Tax=viral metagenome TaxID=1070528 RepID=A0A6C0CAR5_9ZZZZ
MDLPNQKNLPFLGQTFIGDAEFPACTASNLTVWNLVNKLIDPQFKELVRLEVLKMGQKNNFPLQGHQLKSKNHIFNQIVNELLEFANTPQTDEYEPLPGSFNEEDIYSPNIIDWAISYDEPGIAEPWCPIFDEDLNILGRGGTGFSGIIFDGIVSQRMLDEIGEGGFVAAMIIGCIHLPKPTKTLEQIVMDTYVIQFDNEIDFGLFNDEEDLRNFIMNKMSNIPTLVHENPYFRRQLSEAWQKLIWGQYDNNDGCIHTYTNDDIIETTTRYHIIDGIYYVEWIRYGISSPHRFISYEYDNELKIIKEITYNWMF